MNRGITAQMVKELREASGASMMMCKHALRNRDGGFEAALRDLLDKPDGEEPQTEPA